MLKPQTRMNTVVSVIGRRSCRSPLFSVIIQYFDSFQRCAVCNITKAHKLYFISSFRTEGYGMLCVNAMLNRQSISFFLRDARQSRLTSSWCTYVGNQISSVRTLTITLLISWSRACIFISNKLVGSACRFKPDFFLGFAKTLYVWLSSVHYVLQVIYLSMYQKFRVNSDTKVKKQLSVVVS